MHILQNYSLQSGQKIDKIYTLEKFFPLPFVNYLIIQPWSKPSKNYSYWSEVIELIYPYLAKENIQLVQVGSKDEQQLPNTYFIAGQTSLNQLEYLISQSLGVITTDSISSHLAGHYDKNLVVLISNNYISCVNSYFGDKTKQIILEPPRKEGERPSFSLDEGPIKQINRIKPEQIAISILKLLNISHNITQKTLKISPLYNDWIFETVPNQVVDPSRLPNQNLFIRADLEYNIPNIFHQLSVGKASLITNNPLPIEELFKLKQNINSIVYILWPGYSKEFIESCIEAGIKINMVSYKDADWIKDQKIDLFEYGIVHHINKRSLNDFEELKDIDPETIKYKSRKFLLSKGKIFQGKAAYIKGIDIPSFTPTAQKIINNDDFFYDADHFYFLT